MKTISALAFAFVFCSLACSATEELPCLPPLPDFPVIEPIATIPSIKSMRVSSAEVRATGGKVELGFKVDSNVPVVAIEYTLDGPNGKVHKRRVPIRFKPIKEGLWEGAFELELSGDLPAGVYSVNEVLAVNTGGTSLTAFPQMLSSAAVIHKIDKD